jgi:hypothetical protein
MALESRAFGQGRLGVSGANYGGATPEMLAQQQAIAEGRNSAAVSAIDAARMQQNQDAAIGSNMQASAYMPQAQLLNLLNPGMQGAQLTQAGQLAGVNMASQLGLGQVQSQVNTEKIRAELMAGLFGNLSNAATNNNFYPVGQIGSTFIDWLGIS